MQIENIINRLYTYESIERALPFIKEAFAKFTKQYFKGNIADYHIGVYPHGEEPHEIYHVCQHYLSMLWVKATPKNIQDMRYTLITANGTRAIAYHFNILVDLINALKSNRQVHEFINLEPKGDYFKVW